MPSPIPWNGTTGNPTKCKMVNNVIAQVRRAESQGKGRESKTVRELEDKEFRTAMDVLRGLCKFILSVLMVTMAVLQFNLIARGDDVCKLRMRDLKCHERKDFDFAMQLTVSWSKNVNDERACPPQILLGSKDTHYCALLHLALYLEENLRLGRGASGYEDAFLFTDGPPDPPNARPEEADKSPKALNSAHHQCMRKVYHCEAFLAVSRMIGGLKLGTHSLRKFAATFAKRLGADDDDVDRRGRWKGRQASNKVVNGSHISPKQPFIDVCVQTLLCHESPCAHRIHPDAAGVTNAWLKKHVVPFTFAFYGGDTANTTTNPWRQLALPLLWAALSDEMADRMDPTQRECIRAEFTKIDTLPEGITNPVYHANLQVWRRKDRLEIRVIDPLRNAPLCTKQFGGPANVPETVPPAPTARDHQLAPPTDTNGTTANGQAMSQYYEQSMEQVLTHFQHTQHQMTSMERNRAADYTMLRDSINEQFTTTNQNVCR